MGKRSFFSIIFIIFGIIIAGWISYFAFKENRRNKQIENEISSLRQEADKLRQNNGDMKEKITYFETPEFQERIAKEKLNLQKENENVAVIKPSPVLRGGNAESQETKNVVAETDSRPNYVRWWDYFFRY
ncbi:MAG: septum formation initiator family protein [Patescibacteria group bacterium]